MKDLVSIITPTYNSEKYISETIQSIQAQTHTNWELLITDDCSTDQTIKTVKRFQENDSRIRLYKLEKNQGAGIARNNSIIKATGRYIAFCDSDDQWKPAKLEKQVKFMKTHKLAFTYTSYETINEEGKLIGKVSSPTNLILQDMLRNNYVGCLTAIYDTEIIGKQLMSDIRKRQDWVLWLKIFKIIKQTKGMSESLALYRDRSNSISSNKAQMIKYTWIVYNKELKFSRSKSFFLMINFIFFYVKKKFNK
jgi:glycosyltransferase involved in cell wall biosynthesis